MIGHLDADCFYVSAERVRHPDLVGKPVGVLEATNIDPAPDTSLPSPFTVLSPGALTVTEGTYVTRSGDGVKAFAQMRWGASPDALLSTYQPEYKQRSEEVWTKLPQTVGLESLIEDIAPGEYDWRVKALNTLLVSSSYSTASSQIAGLLAPPLEPQNLTISTIGGLAVLRWDLSADLDVRIGGRIVFRHSPNPAASWTQSTGIGQALAGTQTVAVLPLKPGVYLAKCVDSSGIESTDAASVVTSQATALAFANVDTITENPAFSGTKTDWSVDDNSNLNLSGMGLFDDIPDFDEVSSLDYYGGLSLTGTYLFSAGIDLGSVMPVRLTSHLVATVTNQFDLIDDREENIDDWVSIDGVTAAEADAAVYVRATDDDPSGSPTWGAWNRLDSAEFNIRAFQFKAELTTYDPAYNIALSELAVTAEEVV